MLTKLVSKYEFKHGWNLTCICNTLKGYSAWGDFFFFLGISNLSQGKIFSNIASINKMHVECIYNVELHSC